MSSEPTGGPAPPVPAVFHVRRARDLIDRHYAEPLDLDAMARAAGFSRYHFARTFRAAYGETPGRYLTRRRVERAKDLLRVADLGVTEVCALVGFASLGSFSRTFSALVGMPPSEYRRLHVERGGPPPIPGCFVLSWARPGPGQPPGAASAAEPGAGSAAEPGATGGDDCAIADKRAERDRS